MKRPSFQFYPDKWLSDPALRTCSPASRAVWIDLMCLMHDGTPYGHLTYPNGKPYDLKALSKALSTHHKTLKAALIELSENGVIKALRNGVFYSKKMVEDEQQREDWRGRQAKHRKQETPRDVTGLSRVTSRPLTCTTSINNPPTPKGGASLHFERFWQTYPNHRRKEKAKCLDYWKRNNLDEIADSIIDGLARYCKTEEWLKDGGQFVPYPIRFLRNKRWADEALDPSGSTKPVKPRWKELLEKPTVSRNGEIIETRLLKPQSSGFIEHLETGEVFHVSELEEAQH